MKRLLQVAELKIFASEKAVRLLRSRTTN
ncbi:MAG: hypothetical protein ACLP2Y_00925 [Limisphaerales bacterium]